jgi:CRP/FNR family transcriptional regulator, cyclic AMP receptor protein
LRSEFPEPTYAILRGRVTILARPAPDVEVGLFIRRRGELCGEMSFWFGRQVNEVRGAESSWIARIPVDGLQQALHESAPATLALSALLAKRAADAEARLGEVMVHGVKQRLVLLLERLAAGAAIQHPQGALLLDPFTHEELSRMIGASRVAVSQALAALRESRQIIMSGRRIIVASPQSRLRTA